MANQFSDYVWKGDSSQHFVHRSADGYIHELWSSQKKTSR